MALLPALLAILLGAAPAAAQAEATLELAPALALTEAGKPVGYTAHVVEAGGRDDVTGRTRLKFIGPARCTQHRTPPGRVTCSDDGVFTVTATHGRLRSKPVDLHVVSHRVDPAFESAPSPSPPHREVTVKGHTGSCSQTGTLSSKELGVDQEVTGFFTAGIAIPPGTFPATYTLTLEAACERKQPEATVGIAVTNQPPDAVNDETTTTPGSSVRIPVLRNDTDPDGDDGYKSALEVDPPTVGTATVRDDPVEGQVIEYAPGPGFVDGDQFGYRNCDVVDASEKKRDCDGATVTVAKPDPVPVDDPNATTKQETAVPILVTRNDTSPEPERLRVWRDPGHGTAVVRQPRDGTIDYTPEDGFTGEDSFEYDYCEGVVGPNVAAPDACPRATVTVAVEPVPEAVDDPGPRTERDRPVAIDVMRNDNHPVASQLQVLPQPAPEGTAEVQRNGIIRYTPKPGATGTDSFAYDYCKSVINLTAGAGCDPAIVTVAVRPPPGIRTVTPNPTPPNREVVVEGSTGVCQEGKLRLGIPPPGEDVEVAVSAGQDGTFDAALAVPGGTFVDSYLLELRVGCDGRERVVPASLEVRNQPPDAVDDRAETTGGSSVTIPVTENDTDPDGDDGYQTALEAAQPASGATEVLPGGRIRYTPGKGFSGGRDPFTYSLCELVDANGKRDCDTATVAVTVIGDQRPVISLVEPGSTPPGRAVEVAGSTGTCSRAGTLALQGTGAAVTVTGDRDGAFRTSLTVPAGTFPRPYRLELRVDCQGQLQRAEAALAVTNQTPEAADDAESTTRNQAVRIPVLDNDRDPDDPDGYRTLVLVTRQPGRGTAQEQPDLTVVYTPEPGFIGEDRFAYSLCDDVLDAAGRANCDAATVTLAVTDVPVISSVEPVATSPGRPVKVIGNTGSCERAGTLTFHGEADRRMDVTGDRNGRFTAGFTVPERTFPGARRLELVVDCGGQPQRAQAELMVTNRAPLAADDRARTTPDTATAIDVTGNDRDPDDPDTHPTLLLVTDPPGRGTAEVRPDLSVVYMPEPGFVGEDRFTYSLCDDLLNAAGQADCGTATVTVTVDPTGCAPTAGQDPRLRVEPGRGRGGTRLHITAAVDPRLATCQFRLLLGGATLGPDVSVQNDGSISADRGVPDDARPGPSPVRLATLTAETLDEIPFEVVDGSSAVSWLFRLLLSAGLVLAGFLARAAFKRLRKPGERPAQRPGADLPGDLRARPHTGPVESAVEPVNDNTRTSDLRLEPHFDRGVQAVETVEEVSP